MLVNASVLIVDDEALIRRILSKTLKREGYSVTEAVDGLDALEKMKDVRFDFVISDIKMPNMDGLKLLKEIRSQYPDTYVLLITGNKAEYKADDVMAAGAHYFITKPFHNVDISHTLRWLYLRRQQTQRQKG